MQEVGSFGYVSFDLRFPVIFLHFCIDMMRSLFNLSPFQEHLATVDGDSLFYDAEFNRIMFAAQSS